MNFLDKSAPIGNHGGRVRSDCLVVLEEASSGGILINLESKVISMYGESIRTLILEMMDFFEVQHMKLQIQDSGALPFVMAARIEAALKQIRKTEKIFLTRNAPEETVDSLKDRFRFSRLYLPGNTPSLMLNAGLHKPDGLILDLEDAVSVDKKYEARFLVRNALRNLNFYGAEKMVRINQIPAGLEDLEFVVPHGVQLLLVPKCESADQIHQVNSKIQEILKQYDLSRKIWLMPIIESALGVVNAYEIASAANNIAAMAIGLEDYTADLGCRRTLEANESFYARSAVVNACKAAGIQAIDSVFSDVGDHEGLATNVKVSKGLGFDGMGCIHPRQIRIIHENFAPEADEILKAQRIVKAFEDASAKGQGVVSLGTKMIDAPVVKRAEKIVSLAQALNLISENWRSDYE